MWIYYIPAGASSATYAQLYAQMDVNSVFKISTENLSKIYWTIDDNIVAYRDTNSSYPLKLFIRENTVYPMELEYIKIKKI